MSHRLIAEIVKATVITLGLTIAGILINLFFAGVDGCFLNTTHLECNANFFFIPLLGFGLTFLAVWLKVLLRKR